MPPASRITDAHACPLHGGGPDVSGSFNVITGYMPQARVGDTLICPPGPDVIVAGSATVLVNNRMAARLGDATAHGGRLVAGCPTVIIGDTGQGSTLVGAAKDGTPFCEECEKARKALEQAKLDNPPPPGSANLVTQHGKGLIQDIKDKIDQVLPPEKRQEFEKVIKVIKPVAELLIKKGEDEKSVAKWAVAVRQSVANAYGVKIDSYADLTKYVLERNKDKFGDTLGPGVDWLVSEKGKSTRELIDAAANGNLKDKWKEVKGDIVEQLAGKVIDDPRAKELIKAAVTGELKAKIREVGGDIAKDAITNITGSDKLGELAGAAVQGKEKLLEVGSGIAKEVVGKATGNETLGEIAESAIQGKLSDKLGELAGGQVEKLIGNITGGDEGTAKLLSPVTDYLKGKVTERVTEMVTGLIGGGGE